MLVQYVAHIKKVLIHNIENVQKRSTNLIRICKHLPYEERLAILQLATLKFQRYRRDMIEVFNIWNNSYDATVVPLLVQNLDTCTCGNSLKLTVQRCDY